MSAYKQFKTQIMKRHINIYIAGIITLLVTASCEKQLDLKPTVSIEESQALLTSSDVEATLVGAYADLGDADSYGGAMLVRAELLGASLSELNWAGTFQTMTDIFNKKINVGNADI